MPKNTSISLGDHFEGVIKRQIQGGRYGSASEVVRASLRHLEEHEQEIAVLREALIDREISGDALLMSKIWSEWLGGGLLLTLIAWNLRLGDGRESPLRKLWLLVPRD